MPQIGFLQLKCFGGPGAPAPAPAAPPPPEKVPFVPKECRLLAGSGFEHGFAHPGTPEFCDQVLQVGDAFGKVADVFSSWFSELEGQVDDLTQLRLKPSGKTINAVYDAFVAVWNVVIATPVRAIADAVKSILSNVRAVLDLHKCLTQQWSPSASYGILILKLIVEQLEKVRVGIDPGVWFTLDIHIEFALVKRWLDYLENFFAPIEVPSAEMATRAWLLDRIGIQQRDCIWRMNGLHPEMYEVFADTEREQLDWREAIQYARRMGFGPETEKAYLRARGFTASNDVDMAREMYWELPTIADHLHWLTRNVFDPDYVRDYHLMDGFDERFWKAFGQQLTALGMRKETAAYHYAAHWIQPSPEQMKEFIYRSDEIQQATGRAFTLDDFRRILTEQDYSALARDWFAATAYSVPAISYIKEWYRQGIIDRDQLESYHRRLGFKPDDAKRFADIDELQRRRMRASASGGWTTKKATEAWLARRMVSAEHTQRFADLGYTAEEAHQARLAAQATFGVGVIKRARSRVLSQLVTAMGQALEVGVIDPAGASTLLQQGGWPQNLADQYAAVQSSLAGTRRVKQSVTYIRRHFLDGTVDAATTRLELTRLGLTAQAVETYLATWGLMFTPKRKHRTAQQVSADLAAGHIGRPEALVRLTNLGYDDADSRLYLADAQAKVAKVDEQRRKAGDKAGLARSKALAAAAKQADKAHKDILRQMKREMPVGKLDKWAKLGLIGKDFYLRRMALYGYNDADAERYYAAACAGKGAACVDQTPGPTDAVPHGRAGGIDAGAGGGPPV